jgi:hypothetical protein
VVMLGGIACKRKERTGTPEASLDEEHREKESTNAAVVPPHRM